MTGRRWVIVVAAVVFVFVLAAAFVMSRDTPHRDASSASGELSAPRLVRVEASEPGSGGDGPIVGFEQSEDGARLAAMAYASAPQRWMYLDAPAPRSPRRPPLRA